MAMMWRESAVVRQRPVHQCINASMAIEPNTAHLPSPTHSLTHTLLNSPHLVYAMHVHDSPKLYSYPILWWIRVSSCVGLQLDDADLQYRVDQYWPHHPGCGERPQRTHRASIHGYYVPHLYRCVGLRAMGGVALRHRQLFLYEHINPFPLIVHFKSRCYRHYHCVSRSSIV